MKRARLARARLHKAPRGWGLPRPSVRDVPLIGGLLVLVAMAAYFGYDSVQDYEASRTSYNPIEDLAHIHALGFQADDPHKLYVATHEGIVRGFHDQDWSRVGANTDDIMGFAMHPSEPLTFYASGHDGSKTLGMQKTIDGGFTWQEIGLDGMDLHVIAISRANPQHIWAFDGTILHASLDAGVTWSPIQSPTPEILSLAPDTTRAARLYAATPDGVQRSDDAGLTWEPLSYLALRSIAVDPREDDTLIGAMQTGVAVTRDGGLTWQETELVTDSPVTHVAIDPETPTTFYAATASGTIYKTETSGTSWERLAIA